MVLPGIFPYLVAGMVTASGGAWNASSVAEYFHFKGQTYSTTGRGAIISKATDGGNFDELLAATDAELEMIEGVGEIRAKEIREGLRRLQEINLVDRYLQT